MRSLLNSIKLICLLLSFTGLSAQIDAPLTKFPQDSAVVSAQQLRFNWSIDLDADSSWLQVSTDPAFGSFLINQSSIVGDTFISGASSPGIRYYWRVLSYNATDSSNWSPVKVFDRFDPNSMQNLQLWLNADSLGLNNNDPVASWIDKSPNGYLGIQSTGSLQPRYIDTNQLINGHAVVRFDGVNDKMTVGTAGNWKFLNDGSNFSVYTFGRINDPYSNSFKYLYSTSDLTNTKTGFNLTVNDAASNNHKARMWIGKSAGTVGPLIDNFGNNNDYPDNDYFSMGCFYDYLSSGDDNEIYIKGNLMSSKETDNPTANNANPAATLTIAAAAIGGSVELPLDLAEVFMLDTVHSDSMRQLIERYFRTRYLPPVNLGSNIGLDYGFCPQTLDASDRFVSYTWSTGDTGSSIVVNSSGIYSVTVSDVFGNLSSDQVEVRYPGQLIHTDSTICAYDSLCVDPGLNGVDYSFMWSNGSTDPTVCLDQPGPYSAQITDTNACVAQIDTFILTKDSVLFDFDLGGDTTICSGVRIGYIDSLAEVVSYAWSTTDTTSSISVTSTGNYELTVTNAGGCTYSDTIMATVAGQAPTVNFGLTDICLGQTAVFTDSSSATLPDTIASWKWEFGDGDTSSIQNPNHVYTSPGSYNVRLEVNTGSSCLNDLVRTIYVSDTPHIDWDVVFNCNQTLAGFTDLTTLDTSDGLGSIVWDFGNSQSSTQQNPTVTYVNPGNYTVQVDVVSANACSASLQRNLDVLDTSLVSPSEGPGLIAPAMGHTSPDNVLSFQWNVADNARFYLLETSPDSNFSQLTDSILLESLSETLTFPDDTIRTFYWRVSGIDSCGGIYPSATRSFNIFRPDMLPCLVSWYNMDTLGLSLADPVVRLEDQSGNGHFIAQGDVNRQPFFVPNQNLLNGYGSMRFSGNKQLVSNSELPFRFLHNGSNSTVFSVAYLDATNPQNFMNLVSTQSLTGGETGFVLSHDNRNGFGLYNRMRVSIGKGGSGVAGLVIDNIGDSADIRPGFYSIIESLTEFPPGENDLLVNGQLLTTAPAINLPVDNGPAQSPLTIGNDYSNNFGWVGDMTEVIVFCDALSEEESGLVRDYVRFKYAPPVDLGPDIAVSYGFCDSFTIDASDRFVSYLWSTGETSQSIVVQNEGTYSVTTTDVFGFTSTDDITVDFPGDFFTLTDNNLLCYGDSLVYDLDLDTGLYNVLWFNGNTDDREVISDDLPFHVQVTDSNGCSINSDTISLLFDSLEVRLNIGPDTTFCQGNTISILDTGDYEIATYDWITGDNTYDFTPPSSGTYDVLVINVNGCRGIDTIDISISGIAPAPDFSFSTACYDDSMFFTDLTLDPLPDVVSAWNWSFGDSSSSSDQNPIHIYTDQSNDSFRVSLTAISAGGCENSVSKWVSVFALPTADFPQTFGCADAPLQLSDSSFAAPGDNLSTWTWTFPEGTNNDQDPTHTFLTAGMNPVTLTVRTTRGCSASFTDNIEIFPAYPIDFDVTGTCGGQLSTFTPIEPNPSTISYAWDVNSGTILDTSRILQANFAPGSSQLVELFVVNALGCENSVTKTIQIVDTPSADFSFINTCDGDVTDLDDQSTVVNDSILEWRWNLDGMTYDFANILHRFSDTGTFDVQLYIRTNAGCEDSVNKSVIVTPRPVPNFAFSPGFGSAPISMALVNASNAASSFQWKVQGDSVFDTNYNSSITFDQNGVFTVVLIETTATGCSDSTSRSVELVEDYLDIGLEDLSYTEVSNDGYTVVYEVSAILSNAGFLPIYSADLRLNIGQRPPNIETLGDTIMPGTFINYVFKARISKSVRDNDNFICLLIENTNGRGDDNGFNNYKCINIDASNPWQLTNLFPNPASDQISARMITSESMMVRIDIFDLRGKFVLRGKMIELAEGLNEFSMDTRTLASDTYIMRFTREDEVILRRFTVIR